MKIKVLVLTGPDNQVLSINQNKSLLIEMRDRYITHAQRERRSDQYQVVDGELKSTTEESNYS